MPGPNIVSPPVEIGPSQPVSCIENPLQEFCTVTPPPEVVCVPGSSDPECAPDPCTVNPDECQPSPSEGLELAFAQEVLAENCALCHGPALTPQVAGAGVNFITDFDALVENGWVIECAAESSRIVQVLRSKHDGRVDALTLAELTPRDIQLVTNYIDLGCSETEKLCAEQPALEGCARVQAERVLDRQCGDCHGQVQRDSESQTGMSAFDFVEIDQMVRMIGSGLVRPCDSSGSQLVVRMNDGTMPPAQFPQRVLRPSDKKLITDFIDGLCTPPATSERQRLEEVLRSSCGSCHGQSAIDSGTLQGVVLLEDIVALERDGWLIPCNSTASPVVQRMRSGDMPPLDSGGPRPSPADVEALAVFVDRPCSAPAP